MIDRLNKAFDRINDFLDRYILPLPVRFLTFRFVILMTIGLLIPLIVFANDTVLILGINSYLNTMSVAVSSIVLLYATMGEARQKRIAEMQEKRAQEDHRHVTEMHRLTLQELQNQNAEIAELKQIMATLTVNPIYSLSMGSRPNQADTLRPLGTDRNTENFAGLN